MNEVILAIDGGATKTDVTVRARDGTIIFSGKGEGSNYQTAGLESVKEVLSSLLTEVKTVHSKMDFDLALFALAGIDSKQDEEKIRGIVQEISRTHRLNIKILIIENDVEAALIGMTENKPGALLMAGTGSIAYAHNAKGKFFRSGGWGHRAGDEGSGYWIGREVLRSIFRMEDGRGPSTSLCEEVLNKLDSETVQGVAEWLFSPVYSVEQVAKLSTVLDVCALDGDGEAIRISKEAVDELALLIKSVLLKCKLENEPCKVFINGGAITHSGMRLKELQERVTREFELCELVISTKSPIEYIVNRGWIELDRI